MRPRSRRMSCRTSCFRSFCAGKGRYKQISYKSWLFAFRSSDFSAKEPFRRSSSKVDGHLAERVFFWIESISMYKQYRHLQKSWGLKEFKDSLCHPLCFLYVNLELRKELTYFACRLGQVTWNWCGSSKSVCAGVLPLSFERDMKMEEVSFASH